MVCRLTPIFSQTTLHSQRLQGSKPRNNPKRVSVSCDKIYDSKRGWEFTYFVEPGNCAKVHERFGHWDPQPFKYSKTGVAIPENNRKALSLSVSLYDL